MDILVAPSRIFASWKHKNIEKPSGRYLRFVTHGELFTDFATVNYHVSPPFGIFLSDVFPSTHTKQIQTSFLPETNSVSLPALHPCMLLRLRCCMLVGSIWYGSLKGWFVGWFQGILSQLPGLLPPPKI